MPQHASNSERISRAAAEAEAADLEKMSKKRAAPKTPAKPRASAKPKPRIKIVWAVGRPGLEPVKTYPYKERAAADTESTRRGGDFRVAALKVPME